MSTNIQYPIGPNKFLQVAKIGDPTTIYRTFPNIRLELQKWQNSAEVLADNEVFRNAKTVAGQMEEKFEIFVSESRQTQTYLKKHKPFFYLVCLDEHLNIEGCCVLHGRPANETDDGMKEIELELLITNPRNISHPLTASTRKISGIGKVLLNAAVEEAKLYQADRVCLSAFKTSESFYQKHGFEHPIDQASNCYPRMIKHISKTKVDITPRKKDENRSK